MPQQNTALQAYMPKNLAEVDRVAHFLAEATLVNGEYRRSPANVALTIEHGAALGLSPSQALSSIHVIEGKPSLSAGLMHALCLGTPDVCEYFDCVETTAERATFATKRKGRPETRLSFTMAEARAAEVAGKKNWKRYPAAMLRARAVAALARLVYPDLLQGFYTGDELGDEDWQDTPGEPAPTSATPPEIVDAEVVSEEPGDPPPQTAPDPDVEATRRFRALCAEIDGCETVDALLAWSTEAKKAEIKALPKSYGNAVTKKMKERKAQLEPVTEQAQQQASAPAEPSTTSEETAAGNGGGKPDGCSPETPDEAAGLLIAEATKITRIDELEAWGHEHGAEIDALPQDLSREVHEAWTLRLKDLREEFAS